MCRGYCVTFTNAEALNDANDAAKTNSSCYAKQRRGQIREKLHLTHVYSRDSNIQRS